MNIMMNKIFICRIIQHFFDALRHSKSHLCYSIRHSHSAMGRIFGIVNHKCMTRRKGWHTSCAEAAIAHASIAAIKY